MNVFSSMPLIAVFESVKRGRVSEAGFEIFQIYYGFIAVFFQFC